jgi:hypothetical protein
MTWAKQHEATGGKLVIDWESLHARFNRENGRRSVTPAKTLSGGSETNPDPGA